MTKSTITDKRVTSVIERLEHYACNLKWTNVRGAQDLLAAADGLRELQERRKADSEPVELPLDYLQGHKDGLEWAAKLAEANHPDTGDWLYDDPIELAKAIRKGPDMPPSQPAPVVPGKWIPVSERMPYVGVKVLCFPVKDEPIHAVFNGQLWLQDVSWSGSYEPIDNVIPVTVTHWMPLPAAPQKVR